MTAEQISWRRLLTAVFVLLAVQMGFAQPGDGTVPLKAGPALLPAPSADHVAAIITAARGRDVHVVAQFEGPPNADDRRSLAARGLHLLRYVGAGAYFAVVDATTADVDSIATIPGMIGIGELLDEWKLHPVLAAGEVPPWSIVDEPAPGERLIALNVLFHPDVDLADAAALVSDLGAHINNTLYSVNGLVIELPEASLAALAASDAVQWIEPPLPPLSEVNDGNRAVTQADVVREAPYNLDGSGVTVLVYDGGTARATHVDFEGRLNALDSAGVNNHATHVAGTIGGAGVANPAFRGMAPGVTLLSYGLQGVGPSGPLYTDSGDIEADFADAINVHGAVLSNTSLGTNVEANGFACEWQGDYCATDALIDAIVCGSLGEPFRVVWAGGNERTGVRCNVEGYGDYYSISPPCGAKNHLTVGAVNSDDESMTLFSSWGPTDDGRLKPDVCAPGCQMTGDHGVTSCSSSNDTSYTTLCGTSMAAPTVCGLAALVLEDFRAQFPGQPLPRNSTLRAIFAHTAVDLGNAGPDYQFGYGSVRVQNAVDLLRAGRFGEALVDHGGTYERSVVVEAGTPELKVTLVWDDVPAVPNAVPALVNDLDLVVTGPDGTQYYPWTLDPLNPASPAVQMQADHLNNIEQVLVDNPAAGDWTIAVVGYNVPEGPQSFSLAGDGAVNIATVISFPNGQPEIVAPGVGYNLDVQITPYGHSTVPDTAQLHYRVDDGAFTTLPLTSLGADFYRAALPPRDCGEVPTYYVSVETTEQGTVTQPSVAPVETFTYRIGQWMPLAADDFEEDRGWTVVAGAVNGNWERSDPQLVMSGSVATQPEDDHTAGDGTLCFVTGPLAGVSPSTYDVDGGPSHLVSPVFDLAGRDAKVSYWRWYHMSISMDDVLEVAISTDGVNWTPVEEVRRSAADWEYVEWSVSDFVVPNETVQVRFSVNDTDPGSLIEALVDDFAIKCVDCTAPRPHGDLNCDGVVDNLDIQAFVKAITDPAGYAQRYPDCDIMLGDLTGDGLVNNFDISPFVDLLTGE
ncbi:MAG: S8 family serine peptidase [Phycisphaerae bacterium]